MITYQPFKEDGLVKANDQGNKDIHELTTYLNI